MIEMSGPSWPRLRVFILGVSVPLLFLAGPAVLEKERRNILRALDEVGGVFLAFGVRRGDGFDGPRGEKGMRHFEHPDLPWAIVAGEFEDDDDSADDLRALRIFGVTRGVEL